LGDTVKFGQHVELPGNPSELINNTIKVGIYKEEQIILQGFVHSKAEQKIDYYEKKIAEMKQKYDMDFSTFKNKISLGAAEVNLEEWNDFVLWGSYVKAYRYWAQFC